MEVTCQAREQVASPRKREKSKAKGLPMATPKGEKPTQSQEGGQGTEKKTRVVMYHGCRGRKWAPVVNTAVRSREKRTERSRILETSEDFSRYHSDSPEGNSDRGA